MLANTKLAAVVPLACGVKVTLQDTLCPAAMVNGKARPVTVNSGVLGLAAVTVTLAPEAVSVPF